MRIISVVGARPQFVKLAAIDRVLRRTEHRHEVLHTGQHYDREMSEHFFGQLGLGEPRWNAGVGSGPHGRQTAAMLVAVEEVLTEHLPDWVLVYGDTNSTLAGALAAAKLGVRSAHLEAGLRSFNRRMPEEHNRVATDHLCDLLLAPTPTALANLENEGLAGRSTLVGDVMADVLLQTLDELEGADLPAPETHSYYVATIHRAENTDDESRLHTIVAALQALSKPVVLYAHPRLRARAADHGITLEQGAVRVLEPVPHRELIHAMWHSAGVITDSGGVQKEAFIMAVPCTTLRPETEWLETLADRWNQLARPEELESIVSRARPAVSPARVFGAGDAAERSVAALEELSET